MTDKRDESVLRFNPWSDDDSDYRVLDNRMIVTRHTHCCAMCFEAIPAQTRVRAQREAYDGKAMTFRFCPTCCKAMAAATMRGAIERVEKRFALGQRNTVGATREDGSRG